MIANFTTGPVAVRSEVRAAFAAPPISHRAPAFLELLRSARDSLRALVNAPRATLMVGSGTLANDAVAAQIRDIPGAGLILSNGEFGERLLDHATRWRLEYTVARQPWGEAFDWSDVRRHAQRARPAWIWAVLAETSTGVLNPLPELLALSAEADADLCLDAVSAVGLMPVDLAGVRFATAVSGKGLAAYPGLAAVFHDGRLASSHTVPRYLDLAAYEAADGVPFTHSSNLVAALDRSLSLTRWPGKFERVFAHTQALRAALRERGLPPLARDADAAPGIVTLPLNDGIDAEIVALSLAELGIEVAWQSRYLRERNWLQIALMGEIDEVALHRLPAHLRSVTGFSQRAGVRCAIASRDHNRSTSG